MYPQFSKMFPFMEPQLWSLIQKGVDSEIAGYQIILWSSIYKIIKRVKGSEWAFRSPELSKQPEKSE